MNGLARALTLAFAASVIGGCDVTGSESNDTWVVSSEVDPMTDAKIVTAIASFASPPFNIQATVKCDGTGNLSYAFATFQDEEGAEMRSIFAENGNSVVKFGMRLDSDKAGDFAVVDPEFNNSVSFSESTEEGFAALAKALVALSVGAAPPDAASVAQAKRVVLRIPLKCGSACKRDPVSGVIGVQ